VNVPFTKTALLDVFARYNEATWVVTFLLIVMALSGVTGLLRNGRYRDRWASGVLAVLWLWSGIAFHWVFFADVNVAAIVFGLFTLGLLLWTTAPVPRLLLIVPLGWALVAGVAAWQFEMLEDWGLVVAAVAAAMWLLPRRQEPESRRQQSGPTTAVSRRIWKHVSRI
jgi:hypothetical protein